MSITEQASAANVSKLVKEAAKAYGSAHEKVQNAAVAIVRHADAFGDCSQAKVLSRSVPARERNSLIGWFLCFSPIGVEMGKSAAEDKCRFVTDQRLATFRKKLAMEGAESWPKFHIDGAEANPWFEDPAKLNPEPVPVNTLASFFDIVEKAVKREMANAEREDERNRYDTEVRKEVVKDGKMLLELIGKTKASILASKKEKGSRPAPEQIAA